jgi:hypothetical protein
VILENELYVGIELHETYCTAYYYDKQSQKAVPMDITGGFGQVEIPLAIKYLEGDEGIIIGEDAMLNNDNGEGAYYEKFTQDDTVLFNDFLRELLKHIKHINPNGHVLGYCMIDINRNEGVRFMDQDNWLKDEALKANIVMIDYGYRDIKLIESVSHDPFTVKEVKCLKGSGYGHALEAASLLVKDTYKDHQHKQILTEREDIACEKMAHKLIALALQKMANGQGLTLTFHFGHEPFRVKISHEIIGSYFEPIKRVFAKLIEEVSITYPDAKMIFIGSGLKLPWTKQLLNALIKQKYIEEPHYYAKLATRLAIDGYIDVTRDNELNKSTDIINEKLFIFEKGNYEVKVYRLNNHGKVLVHQEVFGLEATLSRVGIGLRERPQPKDSEMKIEMARVIYDL